MRPHLQRQSFLGPRSDEVIGNARVAIIGLCGGGSHIAQQLAHVGVGHFALLDHDRADETNRNRMVGLTAKAARDEELKTEVIRTLIKSVNPAARVHPYPAKWQNHAEVLRGCTAIFGCVDSYTERAQLERYARRYLVPYIDVGMDVTGEPGRSVVSGQVIVSMPGYPCMTCMGFLNEEVLAREANQYGAAGGKPQVVWPNGTLASTAVGKFMALLTPWSEGLSVPLYSEYDGNRLTITPSKRLAVVAGMTCKHFGGPDALGDVF
jgi:hypothetical protein